VASEAEERCAHVTVVTISDTRGGESEQMPTCYCSFMEEHTFGSYLFGSHVCSQVNQVWG